VIDPPSEGRLRTALFTDLYELTMAQAYYAERMDQLAVFELAFRTIIWGARGRGFKPHRVPAGQ